MGQLGHIHRLDLLEGRQALESLSGLLLDGDDESILHVGCGRKVVGCTRETRVMVCSGKTGFMGYTRETRVMVCTKNRDHGLHRGSRT